MRTARIFGTEAHVASICLSNFAQVGSVLANAAQTQLHAKTAVWLALHGRDVIDIDIVIDAPMILLPKRCVWIRQGRMIRTPVRLSVVSSR
jgi:hypothetical protein